MNRVTFPPGNSSFEFYYKDILIRIPHQLNNIARHKSNSFWDWLISKYCNCRCIYMRYEDIVEERLTFWREPNHFQKGRVCAKKIM